MEEKVGHVVVGDEGVGEAIVVVVGEGDAHAAAWKPCEAGVIGDIFKSAVAAIAIEGAGQALKIFGMAIDADVAVGIAAEAIVGELPFRVVDDPEIELAVAVKIEPAGGDGPTFVLDAGFDSDVFEAAVAEIVIQRAAADAGDEDVGFAVIIEIGDGDAHVVTFAGEA